MSLTITIARRSVPVDTFGGAPVIQRDDPKFATIDKARFKRGHKTIGAAIRCEDRAAREGAEVLDDITAGRY